MRKTSNKNLPCLLENWPGNPLDDNGLYKNLHGKSERTYGEVLSWQLSKNPFKKEKINQITNVEVIKNSGFISDTNKGFTWLGHATFLFRLNGKNIITDPVLGQIGPIKRFTELACKAEHLNTIDLILISHNHRDHLDKKSIQQLCRQNPQAAIYTTLGIKNLLRKWSVKNEITEAGWYQKYPEINGISVSLLPAKHWNRRWLFDLNEMLWGSFMIEADGHFLYFGGDSGLDSHFKDIGRLFPKIDYAFLGIGAYEPNWFMKTAHTSPADVLKCHKMLGSKCLFPMHYGTFDLSDEPIYNPKNVLHKLIDKEKLVNIILGKIGEKIVL